MYRAFTRIGLLATFDSPTLCLFQFEVDPTSDAELEALKRHHPMAHVLTSIAAQVSAIQAKAADLTSKSMALTSQKYALLPNEISSASSVADAMIQEGRIEGAADQVLDDM